MERHEDGSFDLEVLAVDRIRMDSMVSSGDFPVADVEDLPEDHVAVPNAIVDTARAHLHRLPGRAAGVPR